MPSLNASTLTSPQLHDELPKPIPHVAEYCKTFGSVMVIIIGNVALATVILKKSALPLNMVSMFALFGCAYPCVSVNVPPRNRKFAKSFDRNAFCPILPSG